MKELTVEELKQKKHNNKVMAWLVIGAISAICILKSLGLGG